MSQEVVLFMYRMELEEKQKCQGPTDISERGRRMAFWY